MTNYGECAGRPARSRWWKSIATLRSSDPHRLRAAERGGELLECLDDSFSLAGLELRDVRRGETRCLGPFLRAHAAMVAPDAKRVFAVYHSVDNPRGDQTSE